MDLIMKAALILMFIIWIICGACQDITPGYLQTEYASYTLDSMVVKKVLDLTPPKPNPTFEMYVNYYGYTPEACVAQGIYPTIGGEEYKRDKFGWPWTSTPIEGVEGTRPIFVTIKNIVTEDGNAEELWKVLKVSGNGTFTMPVYSNVPIGRYSISLTFKNEGYSQDVDNVFTIIVK